MSIADGSPKRRFPAARLFWLSLLGLGLVVLADSHAIASRVELSVVYVVDVSDSIRSPEQSMAYVVDMVQQRKSKDLPDQQSLIVVGKKSAVELPRARSFPFEKLNSQIDRGGTNLEQALTLAVAVINDHLPARVVFVSDGVQTEGDVSSALPDLKDRKISVDVLPIEFSYDREVWLEGMELPLHPKVGETYDIDVHLSSLTEGIGTLVLSEAGYELSRKSVEYQPGTNRFSLPLTIRSNGYHEYATRIEVHPDQDGVPQNNSVVDCLFVGGQGMVLLVSPSRDQLEATFLEALIHKAGREVNVVKPFDIPREGRLLIPYDVIIFCNVARDEFDSLQLQAVGEAVEQLGAGFLMTGGINSFGPGGYKGTVIQDILPVTMQADSKAPDAAVLIILDRFGFAEGNTWGKRLAKHAIRSLDSRDQVAVLAHVDGELKWLFDFTQVLNYDAVVPAINDALISRMPSLQETMEAGFRRLQFVDRAFRRHVIVITNGSPAPPSAELIEHLRKAEITVSTIGVYPDRVPDVSDLQTLAKQTGGRFYRPEDPNQVPALFVQEAKSLRQGLARTRTFTPDVEVESPVIRNLGAFPELKGLVVTTGKSSAIHILNAPPEVHEFDSLRPVLSITRHGAGMTAAFTSSFSGDWGFNWQNWDRLPQFVQQLISEISRNTTLKLSRQISGQELTVLVETTENAAPDQDIQVTLWGPSNNAESLTMKQIAPHQYQAKTKIREYGRYQVFARGSRSDPVDVGIGGLSYASTYSREHLQLHSNRQTMVDIATQTGGRIMSGKVALDAIFPEDSLVHRTSHISFDWMLIVLAVLLPVVVVVQGMAIQVAILRHQIKHPEIQPNATLAGLLKKKQWVTDALSHKGTARMLVQIWSPVPQRPPPKRAKKPVESQDSAEMPKSTIEKLIELKRQQEN